MKSRVTKFLLYLVLGLIILCAGMIGFFALSNRSLPTQSVEVDRLSGLEKARLAEAIHLRETLGEQVWPGWGKADIPYILYNEEYAFLVGYPEPPDGWVKMPQKEVHGGPWEAVPRDTFNGETYYRQELTNSEITPEAFTVVVGDRWVASMQTKEYALVYFVNGFGEQLPSILRPVFPYRLMFGQLMGESENYIGGLEHESFHAYQGDVVPQRLEAAEEIMGIDESYPWDNPALEDAWKAELELLVSAIRAETDEAAAEVVKEFLASRTARRGSGLSPDMEEFERQREWLEGLAKYAELAIGLAGQETPGYEPSTEIHSDPDFKQYRTRRRYWQGQIDEVSRISGRGGDTRFYYSGMAQAVLLDRMMPDWKDKAFAPGVMLEDLLQQAIQ